LQPLLDNALLKIPPKYHELTRLTLKATAGLRLISNEVANKILQNVIFFVGAIYFIVLNPFTIFMLLVED
jgi:Golgi nucleoside diphosphatase